MIAASGRGHRGDRRRGAALATACAAVLASVCPGVSHGCAADAPGPQRRVLRARPLPQIVVGSFPSGDPHNAPPDWPAAAGAWNGKAASFSPATRRLVFEAHREDIRGGSIADPDIAATGVSEYYQAGPGTGTRAVSGTTVLYVAGADGAHAACVGCEDLVDGEGGVTIFKVAPSDTAAPNPPARRQGAVIWANQNKDLAHWDPAGAWLLAAVEMPRHALTHAVGKGEIGMFNDLWAVSADGKTWVQLTDFAARWAYADAVAPMPFACADSPNCPTGCQFRGDGAAGGAVHPFAAYSCSALGFPPPASGVMRPVVSNGYSGDAPGSAKVVWAERVGLSPAYVWGGALQLALADLVISGGVPALVNYRRSLTPTPAQPAGSGLWGNPGGDAVVGAGYEPWSFSADDTLIGLATDVFLSTSDPAVTRTISPTSQAFTDAATWRWRGTPAALTNVTRFDQVAYAYQDNGAPFPVREYGHWEESIVLAPGGSAASPVVFTSSANLQPPWNPADSAATFALETWIMRADRQAPAWRLTHFNEPASAPRTWAYPTAIDPAGRAIYLTVVPSQAASDPPGSIFRLPLPRI